MRTTREERATILAMLSCGRGTAEIAKEINKTQRLVQRWIKRYEEEGHVDLRPSGHRPRQTTEEEDMRLVEYTRKNPFATRAQIIQDCNLNIGRSAVRHRLEDAGIKFDIASSKNSDVTTYRTNRKLKRKVMSKPHSKRLKIDDDSNGSGHVQNIPKGILMEMSTQDFSKIKLHPGFVDHTHFIFDFLSRLEPKLGIFAPRRFGKSSHLDMLKTFLQIHNEDGKPHPGVDGPAEGRVNYNAFEKTNIITDPKYKPIVEEHLGRHPVIHLDFKDGDIISKSAAQQHCRLVAHRSYKEHLYLKTSDRLVPNDPEATATAQKICRAWCDDEEYKKQDLRDCLENLAKYLFNHFAGKKVVILVDEFDAINATALQNVRGASVEETSKMVQDICNVLAHMLAPVTKGGHAHVHGMLVTGVSYIVGLSYSPLLNNLKPRMQFLGGEKLIPGGKDFVPFYGATQKEIFDLVTKLVEANHLVALEDNEDYLDNGNLSVEKIMSKIKLHYNGYHDVNGTPIFGLWSILQFLQTGVLKNYWNEDDEFQDLFKIFKSAQVAARLLKIKRGDCVEFRRIDKIKIHDLVSLYDLMLKDEAHKAPVDVVLCFLMDQGYVSYGPKGFAGGIKVPNEEIKASYSEMLKDLMGYWQINEAPCTALIDSISLLRNKKELHQLIWDIQKELSCIYEEFKDKNPIYLNEARVLCFLHAAADAAKSFELAVDSQIKDPGTGACMTSGVPDFLLLHKTEMLAILIEAKFNLEEKGGATPGKWNTCFQGLQEARGIEKTKHWKFKDYMQTLKTLKRDALIIGYTVDGDCNVPLAFAAFKQSCTLEENKQQMVYVISQREHELHKDFYEKYDHAFMDVRY